LPRKQAEREACELEHAVSSETLKRLSVLIEFVENCPRGGRQWLSRLEGRWDDFSCDQNCEACVATIELPEVLPRATESVTSDEPVLSNREPGWRGTVSRVAGRGAIRRRLLEMGVTSGSEVEVERVAPLGDPLEVKIRGYHLSLRREEAANVHVDP